MNNEKFFETNKAHWNERVSIHKTTDLYALDDFKKGKNKLHPLETEELGDIKGKSILHLQCHFGMDTLSLEMLGAEVTGIDFSEEAIKAAKDLRDELGMKADFILSDVYTLPEKLIKKFDIVYTSYGVLLWLPDLDKWAGVVKNFMKEDGFFYIAEVHPTSMLFDYSNEEKELKALYPYFSQPAPLVFNEPGTYADKTVETKNNTTYEWVHSLSDIFMSLIKAGLKIEFFHEHHFTVWQQFSWMKKGEDGLFRMPNEIPLIFSLKAVNA